VYIDDIINTDSMGATTVADFEVVSGIALRVRDV
jgi:hypothetical protein